MLRMFGRNVAAVVVEARPATAALALAAAQREQPVVQQPATAPQVGGAVEEPGRRDPDGVGYLLAAAAGIPHLANGRHAGIV